MDKMERPSSRRSRRSFPNLQHLSLAPLSSRFPIDDDGYEQNAQEVSTPTSSYIQGKSAPTTPSILSRSHSRQRKGKKLFIQESPYAPNLDMANQMINSKSTSALLAHGQQHPSRRSTGTHSPVAVRHAKNPSQPDDEWLHRAGLAIASEMRQTKGQAWIVSRDSSTSLVDQSAPEHSYTHDHLHAARPGPHFGDFEDGFVTPKFSRNPSRTPSAKTSRRGSRVGSKMDFMTPMDARTPAQWTADGYFDNLDTAEPDFVDMEDEGADDEEEVSRLAKQKGSGLGGFVDRLVGFSLFNVDEDAETEEDDEPEETAEQVAKRKQLEKKRRRAQLERAASSSAIATSRAETVQPPQPQGEEGGWQDAAWLLSVASKVLY
ncbi:hypothetical protein EG328_005408 [Venturia inaequalis]|uniref:Uncharacterized protein n=1 Tax=Venturia inaequalis TaxID=5025 RepID=A0A8H3ZHR3_VENIN|nr:hypothetical protein EG328_005408 [Venturia inaequalis]KAE9992426.1 hypothetical protein EG327_009068 [Venturia inaequalis]RDI82405.1 hypothetical protein Vi05172_g7615 [Venturia inaequalis]